MLEKKGQDCIVEVLYAANEVIRDMAVLLLKALALYDTRLSLPAFLWTGSTS